MRKVRMIKEFFAKQPFYFIQIGAHDGVQDDPIRDLILKYNWSGILVEPDPSSFAKLRENYKEITGLTFENLAIDDCCKKRALFYLDGTAGKECGDWDLSLLNSFYKEIVINSISTVTNGVSSQIQSREVNCISLMELLSKHLVKKIDLLQIDTEGHDYQIIKSIDFTIIKPSMIIYENINLSFDDNKLCERLLLRNGYKIEYTGRNNMDTVALISGETRE